MRSSSHYLRKLKTYLNRSSHEQKSDKSAFDRDVDAGEWGWAIDGCKSDSTHFREANRTVQMWRSRTRRSSHRKRNEKLDAIKDIGEIQTKGDRRRRFGKLRLAVNTKNRRSSFWFCGDLREEIQNFGRDRKPHTPLGAIRIILFEFFRSFSLNRQIKIIFLLSLGPLSGP